MSWLTDYVVNHKAALVRGAVAVLGYLVHNGTVPIPDWVYAVANDPGLLTTVGSLFIPAGEKNKP